MATQWPVVKARLVALLPALSGWSGVSVYAGPPVTNDAPERYATVGYVDTDQAGSYTTVQDPDGYQRLEVGQVACQLVCRTGSVDDGSMESQAFTLMDAVDASIRADRTLGGVLSQQGTSELVVNVLAVSNTSGTAVSLQFTVSYTTVT